MRAVGAHAAASTGTGGSPAAEAPGLLGAVRRPLAPRPCGSACAAALGRSWPRAACLQRCQRAPTGARGASWSTVPAPRGAQAQETVSRPNNETGAHLDVSSQLLVRASTRHAQLSAPHGCGRPLAGGPDQARCISSKPCYTTARLGLHRVSRRVNFKNDNDCVLGPLPARWLCDSAAGARAAPAANRPASANARPAIAEASAGTPQSLEPHPLEFAGLSAYGSMCWRNCIKCHAHSCFNTSSRSSQMRAGELAHGGRLLIAVFPTPTPTVGCLSNMLALI
jgi:hypothetical protein